MSQVLAWTVTIQPSAGKAATTNQFRAPPTDRPPPWEYPDGGRRRQYPKGQPEPVLPQHDGKALCLFFPAVFSNFSTVQ